MINKDDLVSLSWEQKRKFKTAIKLGYLDNFEDNPRQWKHSLVGSFLWKYPNRTSTLNRLKDIVGGIPQWEDLTDDVLTDFVDESLETITPSSVRTFCAELKSVLNVNKRKIPSENFMRILSVKGEISQAVYLTREEIKRIVDYRPQTDSEKYVRRVFLIEFMTGARRSDAERLTINNCDMETNTLSYVPQKTPGIVVSVPVDERLHLRDLLREETERFYGEDRFNMLIRKICIDCKIEGICTLRRRGREETGPKWQFVSSHTARRSFATNLYLAGVSIEDIAVLMGHGKNIDTTKRYICAERPMSSNVLAYFQPQESHGAAAW